jgi:hypothetical protein
MVHDEFVEITGYLLAGHIFSHGRKTSFSTKSDEFGPAEAFSVVGQDAEINIISTWHSSSTNRQDMSSRYKIGRRNIKDTINSARTHKGGVLI